MGFERKQFICVDCESTGLDVDKDRIIEVAAVTFTFKETLDSYESLINPGIPIPFESTKIHNITNSMVEKAPLCRQVLEELIPLFQKRIIVGHGINFDIDILASHCKREGLPTEFIHNQRIDTLRLARLYGDSETNSLSALRKHFNVEELDAHRAMNDVLVNIDVFKSLSKNYRNLEEMLAKLDKPILMKTMPLGKYKGRLFSEMPLDYLRWASHQKFDKDLLFSLRTELKRRKERKPYAIAANPFQNL